jgi:uncharacterized protein (TIGR04255 family)
MSDTPLPDFANPPVAEVIFSVQFEELTQLRNVQMAELWLEHFRDRLPKVEEHGTVDPQIERFGVIKTARQGGRRIRLVSFPSPPVPRYWFVGGTEVVQVQQDRFMCSWRRTEAGDDYPRFEQVREMFRHDFAAFSSFLTKRELGEIRPVQCEITYLNHILKSGVWEDHGQLERVLSPWMGTYSDGWLPPAEDVTVHSRYIMRDGSGDPIGRLHAEIAPGYKDDEEQIHILNLSARGAPIGEGENGIFAFFDRGREWIVRGFTSLTTDRMHKAWGRRDVID